MQAAAGTLAGRRDAPTLQVVLLRPLDEVLDLARADGLVAATPV
jgi:hypothetical protein